MKRSLLALAATTLLAGSALAADLPRRAAPPVFAPVPIFTWTGFYIGVNAGYGFGDDNDVRTVGNAPGNILNVAINRRPARVELEPDGFVGGAQIGYNWQMGSLVIGLEADAAFTDLRAVTTFTSAVNDISGFGKNLGYLGTVRGRLGFAADRFLIYATGGLAYGDVSYSAEFFRNTDNALQFAGRFNDTEYGYTVGGGVEYAFTNAVSAKVEYLYYDLGSRNVLIGNIPGVGAGSYTSRFDTSGHIVRGGLNVKFGAL